MTKLKYNFLFEIFVKKSQSLKIPPIFLQTQNISTVSKTNFRNKLHTFHKIFLAGSLPKLSTYLATSLRVSIPFIISDW
jgi:hypothetical protein